ncbi:unnamed protein product [Heterobilharzia americana]|nr:unnamed protein product [Heterobilharzia americana]CAH8568724.1 unnamed protein product [Heterobilharzia americana]
MDRVSALVEPVVRFSKDSVHFINRCTKPDRKERYRNCSWIFGNGCAGIHHKVNFCSHQQYYCWKLTNCCV